MKRLIGDALNVYYVCDDAGDYLPHFEVVISVAEPRWFEDAERGFISDEVFSNFVFVSSKVALLRFADHLKEVAESVNEPNKEDV